MLRLVALSALLFVPLASWADDTTKTPAEDKKGWKQLFDGKSLDGFTPSKFFMAGKPEVKDGLLILGKGNPMTGVTYTKGDFPKLDYEVSLEAKKTEGNDFFATTTFPVGKSHCSLVVGGWGGRLVGLSSINGADASENETGRDKELKADQWYRIRIRVTKDKIVAWIDKEKVVDLETDGRQISTRIECVACHPFGLATYRTVGAIRDLKVRMLTDDEKKSPAEEK
jgi:hypothetical protein